jgi:hypothetical protein
MGYGQVCQRVGSRAFPYINRTTDTIGIIRTHSRGIAMERTVRDAEGTARSGTQDRPSICFTGGCDILGEGTFSDRQAAGITVRQSNVGQIQSSTRLHDKMPHRIAVERYQSTPSNCVLLEIVFVLVSVMVIGMLPQPNAIAPPLGNAAFRAVSVWLPGVSSPTVPVARAESGNAAN